MSLARTPWERSWRSVSVSGPKRIRAPTRSPRRTWRRRRRSYGTRTERWRRWKSGIRCECRHGRMPCGAASRRDIVAGNIPHARAYTGGDQSVQTESKALVIRAPEQHHFAEDRLRDGAEDATSAHHPCKSPCADLRRCLTQLSSAVVHLRVFRLVSSAGPGSRLASMDQRLRRMAGRAPRA